MSSGIQAVWPPRVAVLYFSLAVGGDCANLWGEILRPIYIYYLQPWISSVSTIYTVSVHTHL